MNILFINIYYDTTFFTLLLLAIEVLWVGKLFIIMNTLLPVLMNVIIVDYYHKKYKLPP